MTDKRVNVVLFEPEIPQNTGNIMRSCVAFGCGLHIIRPIGFDIDSPVFRRSTTNHITWADYELYDSYKDFLDRTGDGEFFFMTRYQEGTVRDQIRRDPRRQKDIPDLRQGEHGHSAGDLKVQYGEVFPHTDDGRMQMSESVQCRGSRYL